MATAKMAPQELDPIAQHRTEFLGKLFRGILVNYDSRPVLVMADRGLFVEGITSLWEQPVGLPRAYTAATYLLDPGQAALFEWFGSCPVIDWYELARMPTEKAFGTETGLRVPRTVITVNHAGDEQWALPAIQVILEFSRLPVYLPLPALVKINSLIGRCSCLAVTGVA